MRFLFFLILLEFPIAASEFRFGRRVETRLRAALQDKIPRLGDRYFHSRLTSDMAERNHSIHHLRLLPPLGGLLIRFFFELVLTVAGIIWLDPKSAPLAILAGALALGIPLAAQPLLLERELRVRSHVAGLSRFYLDALLGSRSFAGPRRRALTSQGARIAARPVGGRPPFASERAGGR